ncbi:MAG: HigA family addiction module antidote protein [Caldilineaceae bacterium SB0662_bin_25]|nr:HigA family addiction module antidote protein [Caldilineaceae bacterium SB0662_bin_25]
MVPTSYPFQPDYAVPPGWVLEERLEANGISQAEFARRCGRSPKFISDIIAGKAPVEAKTALQFEKVLGVSANIWLGIEKRYRLHLMRQAEAREAEESAEWARGFPVSELVKRGALRQVSSAGEKVTELLTFFGVASIEAWTVKNETVVVAYRHSPSFESNSFALAAWLRLAELEAGEQTLKDYDRTAFMEALKQVRQLTRTEMPQALVEARHLCSEAGVALVWVKQLPKARLSGAARWLSPRKPLIALSGRHGSDDQIWFSLFHEAAHVLLHSKKSVYVDGETNDDSGDEAEANEWAANFLIPQPAWQRFLAADAYDSEDSISKFAAEQEIAPGIVIGRLQHEGLLSWRSRLNRLKVKVRLG